MKAIRLRLRIILTVFFIILILGTVSFMFVENTSFADAIYYCVSTVSTVGYGDVVPHTDAGKILAVFLIVIGVVTFLGVVANITELIISKREFHVREKKIHILVGLFFSEMGCGIMYHIVNADSDIRILKDHMNIENDWTKEQFEDLRVTLADHKYNIELDKLNLPALTELMQNNKDFIIRLLENPVLLEHETFTELLYTVFHLFEELNMRMKNCNNNPTEDDRNHIAIDVSRVYSLILIEWVSYLLYLKTDYPYLYVFSIRNNPVKNVSL